MHTYFVSDIFINEQWVKRIRFFSLYQYTLATVFSSSDTLTWCWQWVVAIQNRQHSNANYSICVFVSFRRWCKPRWQRHELHQLGVWWTYNSLLHPRLLGRRLGGKFSYLCRWIWWHDGKVSGKGKLQKNHSSVIIGYNVARRGTS